MTPSAAAPSAIPSATATEEPSATASTAPSAATPSGSPAAGPAFRVVGDAPVIPRTFAPDTGSTLAGAIVEDGGYHAYVVGFSSDPTDHRLYHLTSDDALAWTADPDRPLGVRGVELSHPGPIPTTVFEEDGEWVMYFSGIEAPAPIGFDIWRATAPEPSGPWTADPEPILRRGPAGAWDSMAADWPSVARTDAGYVMLYQGLVPTRPEAGWIGLATSADGVTWTKRDDPATTDPDRAESDPVISPGLCGAIDSRATQQPRLLVDGERLVAAYAGYAGALTSRPAVALAESLDEGVTWRCLSPASALDPAGLPTGPGVHAIAPFSRDGTPALLVEWLADDGSDIWLAEIEPGLP